MSDIYAVRQILDNLTPTAMAQEIVRLRGIQAEMLIGIADGRSLTLDDLKRRHLIEVLIMTNGSRELAAEVMNIGMRTVYRMVRRYGLAGFAVDHRRSKRKGS